MPYMKKKYYKGFTLVELLIVTALISVISLAIYTTFSNGVKIWQRMDREVLEEDLDIFFERFTSDVRNAFGFTGIAFSGKEDSLEFPTLVNSLSLGINTVGQVMYSYDHTAGRLKRKERDFSQVYSDGKGMITEQLKDIKSLEFQYYRYDEEEKEYLWGNEWSKEKVPLAVRLKLEFNGSGQGVEFTKTIFIPAGS
jgi:prepilin-type N-terminal cleavage/methylation domain-containing protein